MGNTKVIGFATTFYTLWNLTENKRFETINNQHIHVGTTFNYTYIQNLSIDQDTAISKVKEKYGLDFVDVDECLRGVSQRSFQRYEEKPLPFNVFPFGKCKFDLIEFCNDVFQLMRVYDGQGAIGGNKEFETSIPLRRRVLARRKLVELGELIRYDHLSDKFNGSTSEWEKVLVKYITKGDLARKIKIEQSSYLHTEGEKIEVSIKEVSYVYYDSMYGRTYIVTYLSEEGNTYIYKGSNTPSVGENEFVKVKATIKHNEYKGIKQTLIQRVKVL